MSLEKRLTCTKIIQCEKITGHLQGWRELGMGRYLSRFCRFCALRAYYPSHILIFGAIIPKLILLTEPLSYSLEETPLSTGLHGHTCVDSHTAMQVLQVPSY